MVQMSLLTQQKWAHRLLLCLPSGEGRVGGRDSYGAGDKYVHSAVFKMDDQQGPTVRHRNSARCYPQQAGNGKEFGKDIYYSLYINK